MQQQLKQQVEAWPTFRTITGGGESNATNWTCSHPDQASETDGRPSSPDVQTSRPRLNVNFVEWLMGVPLGWTDFAPLATELCRWSRLMRSCLFGLVYFMARNDR